MKYFFHILLAALLLASCSATKDITKQGATPSEANLPEAVNARISMSLTGNDLSCSGRLRMLRDDVVQLNLVFMGMNIGTLEFTPDTVLLVDRVNHQYVEARYEQIRALSDRGIDFSVLQGLFWGESMNGRDDGQITWKYGAYGKVNRHKIPSSHIVRFKTPTLETGFDMTLSDIDGQRKWARRTTIDTSKYSQRDPNTLFNALLGL